MMAKTLVRTVNQYAPFPKAMGMQMVSSNSTSHLLELDAFYASDEYKTGTKSIDCIVALALSWGHDFDSKVKRVDMDEMTGPARATNATSARLYGQKDFHITVQEYSMLLSNQDMWLSRTDKDWHTPRNIIIRSTAAKNKRKRSIEKSYERFGKYLKKQSEKTGKPIPSRYVVEPTWTGAWEEDDRGWKSTGWQDRSAAASAARETHDRGGRTSSSSSSGSSWWKSGYSWQAKQ